MAYTHYQYSYDFLNTTGYPKFPMDGKIWYLPMGVFKMDQIFYI